MITKSIKTTSGPLKITIPSDIKELTVGMLMDLTPDPGDVFNNIQQISIMSGVPLTTDDIDKVCMYDIIDMDELAVFDEALQLLAYQLRAFVEVQGIPERLLIPMGDRKVKGMFWCFDRRQDKHKLVPIISNLGIAPAGAYMEAKEVIAADIKEWNEHNPGEDFNLYNPKIASLVRVLSLYLYVPSTGEKFNSTRAAQFDEVVKKLFVTDALPIARYFFLKYPNLSKPKVKPSLESLKLLRLKRE